MWPLNISDVPPPAPARVPRRSHGPPPPAATARQPSSRRSANHAAIASSPVKLCTTTSRAPSRRAGHDRSSEVRQDLVAEEADLVVPLVAPQLEHDVRAAGVAVLLDRGDAVGRGCRRSACTCRGSRRSPQPWRRAGRPAPLPRRGGGSRPRQPGEVEQRVGGALDVLHLVREVHPGDLARAVAALVAILVDRRDDRAADVDVGRCSRACSGRTRASRSTASGSPRDLARERLHLRCGRGHVDGRHLARRVRLLREPGHASRPGVALVREGLAAEHAAHDLTASRIGPSVFFVRTRALFRKIFAAEAEDGRPGPAAPCMTRASIVTGTGWA